MRSHVEQIVKDDRIHSSSIVRMEGRVNGWVQGVCHSLVRLGLVHDMHVHFYTGVGVCHSVLGCKINIAWPKG